MIILRVDDISPMMFSPLLRLFRRFRFLMITPFRAIAFATITLSRYADYFSDACRRVIADMRDIRERHTPQLLFSLTLYYDATSPCVHAAAAFLLITDLFFRYVYFTHAPIQIFAMPR